MILSTNNNTNSTSSGRSALCERGSAALRICTNCVYAKSNDNNSKHKAS